MKNTSKIIIKTRCNTVLGTSFIPALLDWRKTSSYYLLLIGNGNFIAQKHLLKCMEKQQTYEYH